MENKINCIQEGICFHCSINIKGKLQRRESFIFYQHGLCPECYSESIKTNRSDIKPVQLGLPVVGTMPETIIMGPVSFGTMCTMNSVLLKDCIIKTLFKGPICVFEVIVPDNISRDAIRDYLIGEVA